MGIIETASAIALILGSVTLCLTKVIGQLENNRISFCSCLGTECRRDTEAVVEELDMEELEQRLEQVTQTEPETKPPKHNFLKDSVWRKTDTEPEKKISK